MYTKMLILRFPKGVVEKPVVCNLVRDYDLTFNILNAAILPRKEGEMVLQLTGTPHNFDQGVAYLKSEGVLVQDAGEEIQRFEDRCVHCGTCTSVCPTGALAVRRPDMTVEYDGERCSVCKLCVVACPHRAMRLRPPETLPA
jgi:ferredoxin